MILVQFQIGELASLLKYGISGLSAIAFILSFFLLNRESGRPKPRPEMLRSIRMFMALTLVLGIISGIAVILNGNPTPDQDSVPKRRSETKPKTENKSLIKKLISPKQQWQIEVFFDKEVASFADQAADELAEYKEYQVKSTLLTAQRKKELGIGRTQIRHELSEKEAANQLQARLAKIMPQDVTLNLKQITSSSPNYISVFLTK